MYTENQKKGIEDFCSNSYWRSKLEKAPSEAAKEYYAETFAYSSHLSRGQEHQDIMISIFKRLSSADWDYIIENCHNNMGRYGLEVNRKRYCKE